MDGANERILERRKINNVSPSVNMSEDRMFLKQLQDWSTMEFNPVVGEYNPEAEVDGIRKSKNTGGGDSINGSIDQIHS